MRGPAQLRVGPAAEEQPLEEEADGEGESEEET